MSHHLVAFGAVALDSSAGNVQLPAVAESVFNRTNNSFQMPDAQQLILTYGGGINLSRARINTGSLRQRGFPQLTRLNNAVPPGDFPGVMDLRMWPIKLRKEEDLRIDTTSAAAVNQLVALWLADPGWTMNVNGRDLRWIRFTASITGTLLTWASPATVAFEDTLEGGLYDVYGMSIHSTAVALARLILQGQVDRPGCLALQAVNGKTSLPFQGEMGHWGQFNTYSVPQIECLSSAAGADTIDGRMLVSKAA